jgi:hypothetical protein
MLCVRQQFHFSNSQEKVLAIFIGARKPHIDDETNLDPNFDDYVQFIWILETLLVN